MNNTRISRRGLLAGLAAAGMIAAPPTTHAEGRPKVLVSRDPSCGCCSAWAEHIRTAGFPVEIVEVADMGAVKTRLGVPPELASCHTAEVAGYVVEGHVPADAIKRLIAERPRAKGLAVGGMPLGSPGMEVDGSAPDTYDVVLFGAGRPSIFARYRGSRVM